VVREEVIADPTGVDVDHADTVVVAGALADKVSDDAAGGGGGEGGLRSDGTGVPVGDGISGGKERTGSEASKYSEGPEGHREGSCETTCIYAREWPNKEGQKGCFQGFLSGKRKLFSLYAKNSKFFVLEKGKRAFRWKLGGGGRDGES
jgi:hypothetical protein